MPRSVNEKDNVHLVQELAEVDGPFESPINLNFRDFIKLELPSLSWNNADAPPKKMKMTNTGHTVIINGKWKCERPSLSGGPLTGKYAFSQIHFHWGPDDSNGSEHQISGESFPMEMHVAHFKSEYLTQEAALREKDGIVVLVYLFKIQDKPNTSLKKIINFLPCIKQPNSCRLLDYSSILAICNPFTDDYFMYWGSVVTSTCAHILLWIVCREPFGISKEQLNEFRNLLDASMSPIKRNGRDLQPLHKRNVFHVNPSRHMNVPLLPIKNILGCFCSSHAKTCESKKSAGDVSCRCDKRSQDQEDLEVKQDSRSRQNAETSKGNGILKQTIYVQQATVHTIPALTANYPDFQDRESKSQNGIFEKVNGSRISQSCCLLSLEGNEKGKRKRMKKKRKDGFDLNTTLANLIVTLETLKSETYGKLQKMENINDEIKEMKSSCENIKERHWLHHAEKIMSQQKIFSIKSSQCCFSELKKLAKDYDIDRIVERKTFLGSDEGKSLLFRVEESGFSNFLKSNTLVGKSNHLASFDVDNRSFSLPKRRRFSKNVQKLIRNFFEDIRESEEAEMNMKKNLKLKQFEKCMKQKRNSEIELHKSDSGECAIAKNMINLDPIRKKFFIEVKADKESGESEITESGDKKKGFFKISLKAFEKGRNKKEKKSFFNYSPMAWLNKRLNLLSDTSPVISLRLTDFELKSGTITSLLKKKSEESTTSSKRKKVVSKEHIRTKVANFISESYVSEYSDKQTKLSKRSRARATGFIHSVETNSDIARSDLSFMRVIKDFDASNFFVRLGNSVDFSSTCSIDKRENDATVLRTELWKDDIPGIAELQKLETREGSYKMENPDKVTSDFHCIRTLKNYSGRIGPVSGSSILTCNEDGNGKPTVEAKMQKPSKNGITKFRDASVDATEEKFIERPRIKKLKLDNLEVQSKQSSSEIRTISYTETKYRNMSFAESECQADSGAYPGLPSNSTVYASSLDPTAEESEEISHNYTMPYYLSPSTGPSIEVEKISPTNSTRTVNETEAFEKFSRLLSEKDISVIKRCGQKQEDTAKPEHEFECTEITSEISFVPERNWQPECEPLKDFSFEITRTVITDSAGGTFWLQNEPKLIRIEQCPLSRDDQQRLDTVQSENVMMLHKPELTRWNQNTEQELRSVAVLICETEDSSSHIEPNYLCQENETYVYLSNPNLVQNRKIMVNGTEIGCDTSESYLLEELDKTILHKNDDKSSVLWQNDYIKCKLHAGTSTAKVHCQTSEPISRESAASLISSLEEESLNNPKVTQISNLKMNYYRKPSSTETFNPYKSNGHFKCKKKRHWLKKKSISLIRKHQPMIRKFNRINPVGLDFTYLPEEEQLKIISANIAKFVREKLMEHEKFLKFESEPIFSDVERWRNTADQEIINANTIKFKIREIAERDGNGDRERIREVKNVKMGSKPPREKEKAAPKGKFTATNEQKAVDAAGDAERREAKNDPSRQQPDFIKLNKIMAGKYKRLPPKKAVQKPTRKQAPRETGKDAIREEVPRSIPKPLSKKQPTGRKGQPNAGACSSTKESKTLSKTTLGTLSADGSRRSGIPVPRAARKTSSCQKPSASSPGMSNSPSKTCKPIPPKENSLANVQGRQKKRLIPTYTLTSYLTAPDEILQYQRVKFDVHRNEIAEILADGIERKKFDRKPKAQDHPFKKNMDDFVTLRRRVNHEISANVKNSTKYVNTLFGQDHDGSAITGKISAKNSLDLPDFGNGRIFYLQMDGRRDCSTFSSEFPEETGSRRSYQQEKRQARNEASKRQDTPKNREFVRSGIVDSRLHDPDCNSEVTTTVKPKVREDKTGGHVENVTKTPVSNEVSDVLEEYIYQLGGGEISNLIVNEKKTLEKNFDNKPQLKKRKDRILDIPKEMKRKLLNELEDEMNESGENCRATRDGSGGNCQAARDGCGGNCRTTRDGSGGNCQATRDGSGGNCRATRDGSGGNCRATRDGSGGNCQATRDGSGGNCRATRDGSGGNCQAARDGSGGNCRATRDGSGGNCRATRDGSGGNCQATRDGSGGNCRATRDGSGGNCQAARDGSGGNCRATRDGSGGNCRAVRPEGRRFENDAATGISDATREAPDEHEKKNPKQPVGIDPKNGLGRLSR